MTRRCLARIAVLLPLFLPTCGGDSPPVSAGREEAIAVAVEVVQLSPVDLEVQVSGTVRSRNTAALAPRVVGRVREVKVGAGDRVKKGQVLVVLEAGEAEAGVAGAEAGATEAEQGRLAAEAGVKVATADVRLARVTFERYTTLLARRAASQQEFDEAEHRKDAAEAALAVAEARLKLATSQVDASRAAAAGARARREDFEVRAPFTGIVLERRAEPGNLASPATPLVVVGQDGGFEVEAAVEESQMGRIVPGDEARVRIGGAASEVVATVREVEALVDPATRSFRIRADLPAGTDPAELRSGAFARVRFRVGMAERLLVPATAVVRHGQLDSVYVADGETARARLVTLGEKRGDDVEVLSGLAPGERVIRTGVAKLVDGARVQVAP